MRYKKLAILLVPISLLVFSTFASAQESEFEPIDGDINIPVESFYKGEIVEVVAEREIGITVKQPIQDLKVRLLDGDEKNKEIIIENVGAADLNGGQKFEIGDIVVVNKTVVNDEAQYFIQDNYRMNGIWWIVVVFILFAIFFGRLKGITSILGLAISILVIVKFILPQILAGSNPLLVVFAGALIIALVSLYLAHGFNKRTSIALLATLIVLVLSVFLAYFFVKFSLLFGNGSEEAIFLQIGQGAHINLQGLLLGAIILGALGVLDDITTGQAAAVDEIHKANPSLSRSELYKRGLSVGHEHIAALINTLALAYIGASLPLFVLFSLNQAAPFWTLINSEFVAEEIVRTLVGSISLVLAVPITTYLAAYFIARQPVDPKAPSEPKYFEGSHT